VQGTITDFDMSFNTLSSNLIEVVESDDLQDVSGFLCTKVTILSGSEGKLNQTLSMEKKFRISLSD